MARTATSSFVATAAAGLLVGDIASVSGQDVEALRPSYFKKWRENPKMVVFGDSNSDTGRRFNAPASFDFDSIGPFPWPKLFDAPDSDSRFRAYLPAEGAPTNGKVWPSWLRVPDGYNFATSSGTASDAFRSRESCTGYTGEGEEFPTATLSEQVTRYLNDVLDHTDETLDYTHVISMGGNDQNHLLDAFARYSLGGAGYVDPVAFENVFASNNGTLELTFTPLITEIITAWQEGITRLIERGVTGKILLANIPTPKGITAAVEAGVADVLDGIALQVRLSAQPIVQAFPQVRMLDLYSLSAAVVDAPDVFESLGFTAGGSGTPIGTTCLTFGFSIDDTAEIMGTQAGRAEGCQGKCPLCADSTSPCQNCLEGNPSADVCEDPETYIFWDGIHFTTEVHRILGDAIRQCSKDSPDYDHPWVEILCPSEDA